MIKNIMEQKLWDLVLETVLEKKALKTLAIDISEVSLMADYMIICSGRSTTHVKGITNGIVEKAKEEGYKIYNVDGRDAGEWILVDLGTIIVNIMLESQREYYKLEKLWNNGTVVYKDENILEVQNA